MFNVLDLELTPDKSRVLRSANGYRIKYINKKGKVKSRSQCKECENLGVVQIGLGYGMAHCCEREDGWREFSGQTDKECKLYIEKESE